VAKARKHALAAQQKMIVERNCAERSELDSVLKKQCNDLTVLNKQLSQTEFDLKEARFELQRCIDREASLKEENKKIEYTKNEIIADLKAQLDQKTVFHDEKTQIAGYECDKIVKTISALYKALFDSRGGVSGICPKTSKQLLDKAAHDAEQLRQFLRSKTLTLLTDEQEFLRMQSETPLNVIIFPFVLQRKK
jgi:DNA repair exonuclease SbcCD ATPase subunit